MGNKLNLEPVDYTLKVVEHQQFHINELKKQFDHLLADRQGGHISFFSKDLAAQADSVDFYTEVHSFSFTVHFARPYKEVATQCQVCINEKSIDKVRINCLPDRIPLFIETQSTDNPFLYSTTFEDSMEQMGLSKNIIGKSRLYLLDFMRDKTKSSNKAESEVFLPSSVKKLMVFS